MDFAFGVDPGKQKCLIYIGEPYQDVLSVSESVSFVFLLLTDIDFLWFIYLFIYLIDVILV